MFKSTDEANLTMFEEDSEQPLMDANESDFLNEAERRRMLYNNFLIMCVAFSFNHGCVVSCLAYASTELGDQLGAYGSGTLYIAYSLSAFVLAKPIVEMVGPKFGLIFGVLGFCLYVMGFLLSVAVPSVAWPVFMIASIFGGVSGGLLWTAQGKYFSVNAILYAEALDIPVEDVNTQFAGIFAATYLGLEMLTNMIATGVYFGIEENANAVVFSLYAMIALLSCICMGAISNLDEYGSWELDMADTAVHMGATLALLREDLRLLLMVPTQVSFGLVTSFVPYYIFGTVIADSGNLGEEYVGVLAAVAVFAGAAVAIPAAHLAQRNGKHSVMILGGLCFAVTGIVLYFVKNHPLDRWRIIIPYLIVYGIGRGIWVSTLHCTRTACFLFFRQLVYQSNVKYESVHDVIVTLLALILLVVTSLSTGEYQQGRDS